MSLTPVQTDLFGTITIERRSRKEKKAVRHAAIKSAFARADRIWVEEYTAFILEYAETHDEFTAEMCRLAYVAQTTIRTTAEQAAGGIFLKLVKEGKLKKVGFKLSEIYGNNLRTYSLVKSKG